MFDAGVLNFDYEQLSARWKGRCECLVIKRSVRLMREKLVLRVSADRCLMTLRSPFSVDHQERQGSERRPAYSWSKRQIQCCVSAKDRPRRATLTWVGRVQRDDLSRRVDQNDCAGSSYTGSKRIVCTRKVTVAVVVAGGGRRWPRCWTMKLGRDWCSFNTIYRPT